MCETNRTISKANKDSIRRFLNSSESELQTGAGQAKGEIEVKMKWIEMLNNLGKQFGKLSNAQWTILGYPEQR